MAASPGVLTACDYIFASIYAVCAIPAPNTGCDSVDRAIDNCVTLTLSRLVPSLTGGTVVPGRARTRVQKYTWALYEQGSVVLDSAGQGTFSLSPGGARERWQVTLINVTCTQPTTTSVPTLIVYRGSPIPANKIGGTYSANLDTNSSDEFLLNMGEGMFFSFSGGDPGAVGTIRLEGTRYVWE